MDAEINYKLLSEALEFYTELGYTYVEVPWSAPQWILDITKPPIAHTDISTFSGKLVASAEQSYLRLISEEKLPKGKYVTCTPCFRQGDIKDVYHQDHFMKVELINTLSTGYQDLFSMISDASSFFTIYTQCDIIKSDNEDGFDIITSAGKIELGSYGIREHLRVGKWIYGTGCAEPRLSSVLRDEKVG